MGDSPCRFADYELSVKHTDTHTHTHMFPWNIGELTTDSPRSVEARLRRGLRHGLVDTLIDTRDAVCSLPSRVVDEGTPSFENVPSADCGAVCPTGVHHTAIVVSTAEESPDEWIRELLELFSTLTHPPSNVVQPVTTEETCHGRPTRRHDARIRRRVCSVATFRLPFAFGRQVLAAPPVRGCRHRSPTERNQSAPRAQG